MYEITATLINTFIKEKTDKYPASYKLQLLGDTFLKDGQLKKDIVTLSVTPEIYQEYDSQIGTEITLPVAFFARDNVVQPFFPVGQQKQCLS